MVQLDSVFDFVLVFNKIIWPTLEPLRDTSLKNMSDPNVDLSRHSMSNQMV